MNESPEGFVLRPEGFYRIVFFSIEALYARKTQSDLKTLRTLRRGEYA